MPFYQKNHVKLAKQRKLCLANLSRKLLCNFAHTMFFYYLEMLNDEIIDGRQEEWFSSHDVILIDIWGGEIRNHITIDKRLA